jgi:hypothetical protein
MHLPGLGHGLLALEGWHSSKGLLSLLCPPVIVKCLACFWPNFTSSAGPGEHVFCLLLVRACR